MKLTEQEEMKITELLRQKVEKATPQELEEALKFFDMVDIIREQAKQEILEEIKTESHKENLGTYYISLHKATFENIVKRHLSTLPKAKQHNNDFKKVCQICEIRRLERRIPIPYYMKCNGCDGYGKPIQKS